MERVAYCTHENQGIVKIGPRIGVVGCRLEIEIGLEPGNGLLSASGYSRAATDYTAFQTDSRVRICHLGFLTSHGEAVECQTHSCPSRHERGMSPNIPDHNVKTPADGYLRYLIIKGIGNRSVERMR